jgi:putative GTP pyrophosphokinase
MKDKIVTKPFAVLPKGNPGVHLGKKQAEHILDLFQENMAPLEDFLANYRCAVMEIETKFKVLNERYSLHYDRNPIETIKTRVKSMDSIMRKMLKKNINPSLEEMSKSINDIAGVRVICSFQRDVYLMADHLLEQDDITLIKRKDYIANPKENGYRSLHLIVSVPIFTERGKIDIPVEVQLRTIAMDFWASLEHKIRYKKDIPEELRDELSECLAKCAERSHQLDLDFQNVYGRLIDE